MKAGTSQYFMPQFDFNTATPNASLSTKELPSYMPTLVTSVATKDAYYPRTDTVSSISCTSLDIAISI